MMIKRISLLLLFMALIQILVAQKSSDYDLRFWSSTEKINLNDFGIKTNDTKSGLSSASFYIEYQVNGLNFLTKNFNKKVRNAMIRSASQIDTVGDTERYILYQQTLFDLSEVYTRQFRKSLRENRKQLIKGTDIAEELNRDIMTKLQIRKTEYTNETNSASDSEKQREWQENITKELEDLKAFAYEAK